MTRSMNKVGMSEHELKIIAWNSSNKMIMTKKIRLKL